MTFFGPKLLPEQTNSSLVILAQYGESAPMQKPCQDGLRKFTEICSAAAVKMQEVAT
jgi:hypothetical protein